MAIHNSCALVSFVGHASSSYPDIMNWNSMENSVTCTLIVKYIFSADH
jgi:hypothetical protein